MEVGKSQRVPTFQFFFGTVRFFSENKIFPLFNFLMFCDKTPSTATKMLTISEVSPFQRAGAQLGPFFVYVIFRKKIFVKDSIFEYCKREYLTLCSLFTYVEPWILRRLGPVPACFILLFSAKCVNFCIGPHY